MNQIFEFLTPSLATSFMLLIGRPLMLIEPNCMFHKYLIGQSMHLLILWSSLFGMPASWFLFEFETNLICYNCWCSKWFSSSWQIASIMTLCYLKLILFVRFLFSAAKGWLLQLVILLLVLCHECQPKQCFG